MSRSLRERIFAEIDAWALIDPHTHINPHAPAAANLAELLGYHYYTELCHSAGMSRERIEQQDLDPREKVRRLAEYLPALENTVQYSWLIEICQELFSFREDRITSRNWESLFDAAQQALNQPDWPAQVLERGKLESVFLTNDFDDPLGGFDTGRYIPCLRTDDLAFGLHLERNRRRLEGAAGVSLWSLESVRQALEKIFAHFVAHGAKACAISLPPDFAPRRVEVSAAKSAWEKCLSQGEQADDESRRATANYVFWTLAELCAGFRLPFDLMIGVNRNVYAGGVHQGRDLYDSRVSLIQYQALFNAFPQVTFPVSMLASATNQELVSYSWIFPNVVAHGHWWYSNTPSLIERDAAHRLEAIPHVKQIGYYSDMYKLEFALPKFAMYKRVLAKILAEQFVLERRWSEERAVALGRQVLRGNVERVFFCSSAR